MDPVREKIYLAVPLELKPYRFFDYFLVFGEGICFYFKPAFWCGFNGRNFPQSGKRQIERPGNGGGGKRKNIQGRKLLF